jgi:hypothetical protein
VDGGGKEGVEGEDKEERRWRHGRGEEAKRMREK